MYWYQWTVGFLFYVFIYFYSTDVCYLLPVGMGSRSWFLFLARRNWALSRSPFSILPSWFQFVPLILRQQNSVCVWIFCSHIVPWTQWGWMEEFHEVLRGWLDHFGPEYTVGLRQRLIFLFFAIRLIVLGALASLTADSGQEVNELRCMELKGNEND